MKVKLMILIASILPEKLYLKLILFYKTGEILDFRNPKTMNAKIQWKKIYRYDPIHDIIADKLRVREYVKEKIGEEYLVPLIKTFDSAEDLCFKSLPYSFVLKSNNASAMVEIIKDKNTVDLKLLQKRAKAWFRNDYHIWTKEYQYENIETKILIEKLLKGENGNVPDDFKFHCFSGKVEYIQVDKGRFTNPQRSFYSTSWEKQPFNWGKGSRKECALKDIGEMKKPDQLGKMIELAEVLSADFDYIRVDFYVSENQIYFGELTLHPTSGYKRFYPEEYNRMWGKLVKDPMG